MLYTITNVTVYHLILRMSMHETIRALVKPNMLISARKSVSMDEEYAARKIGISPIILQKWEAGEIQPTIKQLRNIAKIYGQNFAAFFLPEPPPSFKIPVKDFRRHHGSVINEISSEIILDIKSNLNIREISLELSEQLNEKIPLFTYECSLNDTPEKVASYIRKILSIDYTLQLTLRDSRLAFNLWRERLEQLNCLVFQSTKIDTNEMRGYSIFFEARPLIVVNRKDSYAARLFTLIHEFTHILLRQNALCDLEPRLDMSPHEQKIEIFCNAVAGQTLVPDNLLLQYKELQTTGLEEWKDYTLAKIANDFGVSREMILRKLLNLGLTTQLYYEAKRQEYIEEIKQAKLRQKNGFVPPATDVISLKGKPFVGLIMDSLNLSIILPTDASDFLGVKAKHFSKITLGLEAK